MAVPKKKNSKVKVKYSLLKKSIKKNIIENIIFVKNMKRKLNEYKLKKKYMSDSDDESLNK